MNDPLASLEKGSYLPAALSASVPAVDDPLTALASKLAVTKEAAELREQVGALSIKLAEATGKAVAQAKRIEELEKGGGLFGGKWKTRVAELETQVEDLMATNARLTAELEAAKKGEAQSYLPAVAEVSTALALVQKEVGEARYAVARIHEENTGLRVKVDDLEFQRDERDSMLRDAEARERTTKAKSAKVARQVAQMRMQHLVAHDPTAGAGAERTERSLAKTRVLAGLGNVEAQVMLGSEFMDNTCAMCRASPACERDRLLNWPHGPLIPRNVQDFLQVLVDNAQENGRDPFEALEQWASGAGVETVEVAPEQVEPAKS